VQRNVIAHDRGRHRVFIREHDLEAKPCCMGSSADTRRAGADHQKLAALLNRQRFACD
jgi:hypothetical protein